MLRINLQRRKSSSVLKKQTSMKKVFNSTSPVSVEDQGFLTGNLSFHINSSKRNGGCPACDDNGAGCGDCGGPSGK